MNATVFISQLYICGIQYLVILVLLLTFYIIDICSYVFSILTFAISNGKCCKTNTLFQPSVIPVGAPKSPGSLTFVSKTMPNKAVMSLHCLMSFWLCTNVKISWDLVPCCESLKEMKWDSALIVYSASAVMFLFYFNTFSKSYLNYIKNYHKKSHYMYDLYKMSSFSLDEKLKVQPILLPVS